MSVLEELRAHYQKLLETEQRQLAAVCLAELDATRAPHEHLIAA